MVFPLISVCVSFFHSLITDECTHGDLRIVDAPYTTRGRLEVCLHGVWGTITHIGFSVPDSWVACRQLGFYNYCE